MPAARVSLNRPSVDKMINHLGFIRTMNSFSFIEKIQQESNLWPEPRNLTDSFVLRIFGIGESIARCAPVAMQISWNFLSSSYKFHSNYESLKIVTEFIETFRNSVSTLHVQCESSFFTAFC